MELKDLELIASDPKKIKQFNDMFLNQMIIKITFDIKAKKVSIGKILDSLEMYADSDLCKGDKNSFYLKDYSIKKYRGVDENKQYDFQVSCRYYTTGYVFTFKYTGIYNQHLQTTVNFLRIMHNFTQGKYEKMDCLFYRDISYDFRDD